MPGRLRGYLPAGYPRAQDDQVASIGHAASPRVSRKFHRIGGR